jgi:hypothetical protein
MIREEVVGGAEGVGIGVCGVVLDGRWERWIVAQGGDDLKVGNHCSGAVFEAVRTRLGVVDRK